LLNVRDRSLGRPGTNTMSEGFVRVAQEIRFGLVEVAGGAGLRKKKGESKPGFWAPSGESSGRRRAGPDSPPQQHQKIETAFAIL